MPIITLTTDFGDKDHFVGAVKGAILSELDNVTIVDISHKISPFNIHQAAYILQNSITSFPPGTVHIIGVDSERNPENKHVAVEFSGATQSFRWEPSQNGDVPVLPQSQTAACLASASFLLQMATAAPNVANPAAMVLPSPFEPPVTSATESSSRNMESSEYIFCLPHEK